MSNLLRAPVPIRAQCLLLAFLVGPLAGCGDDTAVDGDDAGETSDAPSFDGSADGPGLTDGGPTEDDPTRATSSR